MAEGIRIEKDEISPWLHKVAKRMEQKAPLEEAGELMVTMVREAHQSGQEFETGRPMQRLSKSYQKRKRDASGSSKKLFGIPPTVGSLFRSWRVLRATKDHVVVGAGDGRNRRLASAHDGGLARHLSRPELNRLRLSFGDKSLTRIAKHLVERYFAP